MHSGMLVAARTSQKVFSTLKDGADTLEVEENVSVQLKEEHIQIFE